MTDPASPAWRRIASLRVRLRPSCAGGTVNAPWLITVPTGAVVMLLTWQTSQPMRVKSWSSRRASAVAASASSRGGAFVERMNRAKASTSSPSFSGSLARSKASTPAPLRPGRQQPAGRSESGPVQRDSPGRCRLTDDQFRDLVEFVRDGLFDACSISATACPIRSPAACRCSCSKDAGETPAIGRPMRVLRAGLTALGLLLLAEFALALPLRGLSYSESWQARDPVAGAV